METETIQKRKLDAIPKLRFREFDHDWKKKSLSDITKINQGLQIAISERYTEVIDGGSFYITNEFLREGSKKKYYIKDAPESVRCSEDDILMTRTGNTGQVVTGVTGAFHNNFFKIKYSKDCAKWFLFYFLTSHKTQHAILKLAGTSTIPDLNHSDFYKIKIDLPSLPEQQKIASFLSAVDKKIQQLTRKKDLLESYKKGVMQQLFSQEIRFQDKNGTDYPKWEKTKYGEIYSFLSTNSFSRDQLNYEKGEVKNIHYGDIHTKFSTLLYLEKEDIPYVNSEIDISKIKEENYCQEGDLVIADASEDYKDIGKTIELIQLNGEKVLAGLHTFIARPAKGKISKGFSGYLMQSWKLRKQVMTIAQGTKVLGLSASRMKKLKIEVPSLEEQQKIADFLSAIDKKIAAVSHQIEKTQHFKKGLLQQMFV